MMTRIDDIRIREKKATPGPLAMFSEAGIELSESSCIVKYDNAEKLFKMNTKRPNWKNDRDFYFCARSDIPYLLDKINCLEAENKKLQNILNLHGFNIVREGEKITLSCMKEKKI